MISLHRGVALACALSFSIVAAPGASADDTVVRSAVSGTSVSALAPEQDIGNGGVIAHIPAGGGLDFYGVSVRAGAASDIYVGLSTSFFFAACLDGAVTGDDLTAGPGEVIVWDFAGDPASVQGFDARRFLATSDAAADPTVRAALEAAAERQQQLIWWGRLRRASLNLQAPGDVPSREAALRGILSWPTVVRLRRAASGHPEDLPGLVANRFVLAVASHDREAITALLDPTLFARPDQAADDWAALRAQYAETIMAGPLPSRFAGARVDATGDPGRWKLVSAGGTYELRLNPVAGMPLVAAVERQGAGLAMGTEGSRP